MTNGKKRPTGRRDSPDSVSNQPHVAEVQPDSSENQPAKRSRVSRACDQCRASREKCDGAHPKCRACRSQDRDCSYNEQPKKRGIQPNYIRTLEITLAWTFRTFPEVESRLSHNLPDSDSKVHQLIRGKDATASDSLHRAWRECIVNRQIDQMLSGGPIEKSTQTRSNSFPTASDNFLPMGSTYDSPSTRAESTFSHAKHEGVFGRDDVNINPRNQGSTVSSITEVRVSNNNDLIQLPENAWTLFEYYFAFTHSWLPMTEKFSILKLMYAYHSQGAPRSSITLAEHAELWSIMALAAAQLPGQKDEAEIQRIRATAESLIPTGDASYKVPHIKAMLILALVDIQNDRMLSAWFRVGSAVRILALFKLIEVLGSTDGWCRHVHLAAYAIESALASYLHAPSHLTAVQISKLGFVDEDGLDEWSPWADPLDENIHAKTPARSFSTFNEVVKISMLSSENTENNETLSKDVDSEDPIVFLLLRNASRAQNREQPSSIVANHPGNRKTLSRPVAQPQLAHARNFDSDTTWDIPANPVMPLPQLNKFDNFELRQEHANFPDEVEGFPYVINSDIRTASQETSTPGLGGSVRSKSFQSASGGSRPGSDPITNPDIFEELATLERTDTSQHPQFMQNLGFGPDLDLAEFFGADYQPSDPLFAYIQPMLYSRPPSSGRNDAV